jgi:signal transduction histidine kinase
MVGQGANLQTAGMAARITPVLEALGRSRVAWPVLGLIALIGLSGFLLLGDIARDQDNTYARNTTQFVRQAVESEVQANASISVEYSKWDDAYVEITRENDMAWAETNFFSIMSSAIFVVRPQEASQSKVRFTYVGEGFEPRRAALTRFAETLIVKRTEKVRSAKATTYKDVHPTGLVSIDGQLASVAVQPLTPSPENHEKLFDPKSSMDYVIVISFVDAAFVAKTQRTFGIDNLSLKLIPPAATKLGDDLDHIGFDLKDISGASLARVSWKNERPGSSAFSKRIVPILAVLVIVGLLTTMVTQHIVAAQMRLVEMARQAAEEGSKAKSSFLANVSHELRTPLNAIIGFAEIIDEDCSIAGNKTTAQDARKVSNSAQHLLGLINDLLDHSKIEAGKMDMDPVRTDLHLLVHGVAEVLESHVAKNNSQLVVRCDPLIGEAMIDGMRLKQCLLNLVSNAAKFTKDGTVTLSARPVDQDGVPFIRITVKDTGIGMSEATMAKLFTPFVQASESTARHYGGTGLGLVITRRLCEAMGGSVCVESVEGKGSTFTMLVPRGMAWTKSAPSADPASGIATTLAA